MHHKKIRDLADHMTADQLTTVTQLFEDYEDEEGRIESTLQKITTINKEKPRRGEGDMNPPKSRSVPCHEGCGPILEQGLIKKRTTAGWHYYGRTKARKLSQGKTNWNYSLAWIESRQAFRISFGAQPYNIRTGE